MHLLRLLLLGLVGPFVVSRGLAQDMAAAPAREHLLMDFNWKFALGNANDQKADFDLGGAMGWLAKQNLGNPGVFGLGFDDSKWKTVNLPHDWGMELPFNRQAEGAWGSRPLGRPFPETSIGWYRKTFDIPATDKGRRIAIEFEGVCHDCIVEVNGFFVGTHFSAYESFSFDITDFIHFGGRNVVSVRVDASKNEGWWYQGAGIYRHVWLTKTAPVHVPLWGTQVLTAVGQGAARVGGTIDVANDSEAPVDATAQATLLDDAGQPVGSAVASPVHLDPWSRATVTTGAINVPNPKLWSLTSPTLYRLISTVLVNGVEVDRTETPFGLRTLRFDPNQGFFLNGQHIAIQGFCDHEEHAIVGTAIPDALYAWRAKKMKEELGGNAIRMSHNPPAPAFLDACDRLGVLVMDEQRLFSSGAEGLHQLDSLVRRDRNHPSVIIWSAGNEEWGLQSSPDSIPVMRRLQDEFHRLDPTRPVTFAASNGGNDNGLNPIADVRGINYVSTFTKTSTPDDYHAKYPQQPVVGTEESRDDLIKFQPDHPWYSGGFIWTGFDYYGECKWPDIASGFGQLDLCGFPVEPGYSRVQKAFDGTNRDDDGRGGAPAAVHPDADRTTLQADGEDVAVVNLTVVDGQGRRCGNAKNMLTVQLTGPGVLLGLGNGDHGDQTLNLGGIHAAFQGRAQALVRTTQQAGTIELQVSADGLSPATVDLTSTAGPRPAVVP